MQGPLEKELVEECVGMSEGHFPLKYLGRHITHSKKGKKHYKELIKKVRQNFNLGKEIYCHMEEKRF